VVASAETLAYAVATGAVGDPRSFKRPVRITVPRTLPTDDVLIVRKGKGKGKEADASKSPALEATQVHGWKAGADALLPLVRQRGTPREPSALVLESLDDVRWFVRRAPELSAMVRAVIAPHIPSGAVPILAGLGILALAASPDTIAKLKTESSVRFPDPREWNGDSAIKTSAGSTPIDLVWLAVGAEREWTATGTARPAALPKR
jgi:aconitate hydratase